ncbi:Redoxin [Kalmanozyma brasiliensis GHG001]|uniref:Putative peroxiredoxin n=1 Tax=Kalmanozyma brasiliensis (strain GHG001) TaxID=1365824 RepID=V5ETB2_KALBG|nr:Redoxin [Kalmanozyma brasiliensis GHG001]EST05234.1 Redoxin [Kalmanozyma brasiliensis GHG001]
MVSKPLTSSVIAAARVATSRPALVRPAAIRGLTTTTSASPFARSTPTLPTARTAIAPVRCSTGSTTHRFFATTSRTQTISKGDQIPNSTFMYVPYTPELADGAACGAPTKVQTHEAFKGKKVVIVAVPGAYTPTCHVNHIPPYIKQIDEFKSKGVDQIVVLAQNDPFVMSAWGRQNNAADKVIFATDLGLEFSKGVGSTADLSAMGFGERTGRYALIVDDLKVVDFSAEPNPGAVEVSGADHVLPKL